MSELPTGDAEGEALPTYVYWDYCCPFCYVGERRLARLRSERSLDVHWRPFEIHPGLPEEGIPVKELGYAPDRWTRMVRLVEEQAEELGLPLEIPSFVPRTRGPLQAAAFAQDVGGEAFGELHRALFRAYFADGRNIGRRPVLLEVAEEAGVDREGLENALEDERYADELRQVREETERYEITGTPTFLFGPYKVVGAAPMEVMREAATRAAGGEEGAPDPQEETGPC